MYKALNCFDSFYPMFVQIDFYFDLKSTMRMFMGHFI